LQARNRALPILCHQEADEATELFRHFWASVCTTAYSTANRIAGAVPR
jgi:hypothetical protein